MKKKIIFPIWILLLLVALVISIFNADSFWLACFVAIAVVVTIVSLANKKPQKSLILEGPEEDRNKYFQRVYDCLFDQPDFALHEIRCFTEAEFAAYLEWTYCHTSNINQYKKLSLITDFVVIKPTNEIETKGEILTLSIFGEYCPEASLRGYELKDLLLQPENYKPLNILHQDQKINLV
jgi:hypothetical protein